MYTFKILEMLSTRLDIFTCTILPPEGRNFFLFLLLRLIVSPFFSQNNAVISK